VRGELFALLTLAVTFVIGTIVVNTPIDGGNGVSLSAVPVPAVGPTQSSSFYLIALAAATSVGDKLASAVAAKTASNGRRTTRRNWRTVPSVAGYPVWVRPCLR